MGEVARVKTEANQRFRRVWRSSHCHRHETSQRRKSSHAERYARGFRKGRISSKMNEGSSEMLTELRLDETDHRRRRIGFTGVGEGDSGIEKLERLGARERDWWAEEAWWSLEEDLGPIYRVI